MAVYILWSLKRGVPVAVFSTSILARKAFNECGRPDDLDIIKFVVDEWE